MKNFVKTEIETITDIATRQIPAIVAAPNADPKAYDAKRIELNFHLIQALCGAELVEAKKAGEQNKMKFIHSLPTKGEIAQICGIVDTFIRDVENPYFVSLQQAAAPVEGDDMQIPAQNAQVVHAGVPAIEKVNNKILKNYIFGYDGHPALSNIALTAMDCITISAFGEQARKKANMNKMFIIGGIAVVLTAGAVAAVMLCGKKDGEETEECADAVDEIDINMDEPGIDLDDAPTVELDDEPAAEIE